MGYPQPGTYMSPYAQPPPPQYWQQQQQPQYWQQQQQPQWYGPPPWVQPPQQQQPDTSQNLIGLLLPIITTMPALRDGVSVANQLQTALIALGDPPQLSAQPTQVDYNKLLNYSISVKNAVTQSVGNDSKVFAALKQSILLQLFGTMSTGSGGSNSSLLLIVLLAFGGLGT